MNGVSQDPSSKSDIPLKRLWIPLIVVGIIIASIGWYRFDDPGQEKYVIYTLLIGLAVAVFPWIKSLKIKGLFELERSIGKIQEETNQHFRELRMSLNLLQSQVTTQKVVQGQNMVVRVNTREITDEERKQNEVEEKKLVKQAKAKIEPKNEKASFWQLFSRAGNIFKKVWIEEACKKHSIDIEKVTYGQAFSVTGDLLQDPLLSLMDISFDAMLPTQYNDIFFEIQRSNKTNDEIHNYLFRTLSFLEKYREASSKQYKLILLILYWEKSGIKKDRAEAIEKYTNTNFSAFISEGRLEIDLYDADKLIKERLSENKSSKNDDNAK